MPNFNESRVVKGKKGATFFESRVAKGKRVPNFNENRLAKRKKGTKVGWQSEILQYLWYKEIISHN